MPTNDTFGLASFLPAVQLVTRIGKQAYNGLIFSYSNFTANSTVGAFADDSTPGLASSKATSRLIWAEQAFLISRWSLANFLMTCLLYLIHTLNIPRARLRRWRRGYRATLWEFIIPIDPTSPRTRLICRLPSLFLLLRSIALLFVIFLQTADAFPATSRFLSTIGDWAAEKQFADVCWTVFKSVCFAMLVGGFFSSLEGNPFGGEASFNLFPYSMLLYHTSTLYHKQPDGLPEGLLPSRPNKHAVIAILMPLLLVTHLHLLPISKTWSNRRLIPSAFFAVLYQCHLLYVLSHRIPAYPLSSAFGGMVEVVSFSIVFITIFLRALSQLLLEGRVTISVLGHESCLPSLDDDYASAIMKLAAAIVHDFIHRSGLSNELAPLGENTFKPVIEISEWGARVREPAVGRGGFNREFKTIEVVHGRSTGSLYNWRQFRDACVALFQALAVLFRMLRRTISGPEEAQNTINVLVVRRQTPVGDSDDDVYERFLAGHVSDDDGGVDYTPGQADDDDEDSENEEPDDNHGEEFGLYGDLLQPATTAEIPSSSMAPVLLAHMTSPNAITRRRYRQLVSTSDRDHIDAAWLDFLQSRRAHHREDADRDSAPMCVVCLSELRTIVCWPCRCLALCDDCRASIAAQQSMTSSHPCPCCRQTVKGFSRIFIP